MTIQKFLFKSDSRIKAFLFKVNFKRKREDIKQINFVRKTMTSTIENFEESVKNCVHSLLTGSVLPQISQYLSQEKDVEIDVEELIKALDLPVQEGSPSFVPPVIKSGSRRRSVDDDGLPEKPEEGIRCVYQFQRGKKKGKFCGKPCAAGLNYCKYCKGKRSRKSNTSTKTSSKSTDQETGLVSKKEEAREDMALTVESYCGIVGHFRHPESNFILIDDDNVVCAIAKELETGELRSLTDEEKIYARKFTLVTIDDKDKEEGVLETLKQDVEKAKALDDSSLKADSSSIPTSEAPLISQKSAVPILPGIPDVPSI